MSGLDELLEAAREVESADAARSRADERLLDAKVQLAKLLPHKHPYRMTMDLLAAAHRRIGELVAAEPDVKPATIEPGDQVIVRPTARAAVVLELKGNVAWVSYVSGGKCAVTVDLLDRIVPELSE